MSSFPTGILRVYPLCGVAAGLFPGCVRRGGGALHPLLQEHLSASRPRIQCRIYGLFPHQGTLAAFFLCKYFEIKPTKGQVSQLNLISKLRTNNK